VEAAFGAAIQDNRVHLPGIVSRKLQVVPMLTEAFDRG